MKRPKAKSVEDYLIHNDSPTQKDLDKAQTDGKVVVTYLKLPEWISMFGIDIELLHILEEQYLKTNKLERSMRHVVIFIDHDEDSRDRFKNYCDNMRDSFLNSPTDNVVKLVNPF